jgi:ubiquinone biosynthesis protein
MSEQVGWRGVLRGLAQEAPYWAAILPQLPRLVHRALTEDRSAPLRETLERLARESERRNDLLQAALVVAMIALALAAAVLL